MPYLKPKEVPCQSMKEFLMGKGFTPAKLAAVWGCSIPTARDKLQNPEKITLRNVLDLAKYGHLHIDDLRKAIRE